MQKYLFFLLFFLYACSSNSDAESIPSDDNLTIETVTTTSIEEQQEVKNDYNFELPYDHTYFEFEGCNSFMGNDLPVECGLSPEVIESIEFNGSVTNIEFFNDFYFVVLKNGRIVKYNPTDKSKEIVLDISNNVLQQGIENGLLSLAIDKKNSEFVISYVDLQNNLNFEIFKFDEDLTNVINKETLLSIESKTNSHYGGKVIWSEYYQCFLGSIGDLKEANFESRSDSDSLNTTKYNGKILGLNCADLSTSTPVLDTQDSKPLENLIATGLRNPWQFLEFKDYLIVFDTGFTQNEELNVTKYENITKTFGWPVFEATKRSEDLDNILNYSLDISLWSDGEKSAFDYIYENSVKPVVYYNHYACESDNQNCDGNSDIYRAAIIGGDILSDPNSPYNFDIFFADFLSQELFSYNLVEGDLKIYNLEDVSYINVVKVLDSKTNKIIVGTDTGYLKILQLKLDN